jgi:uncharacterized damage-inducible protein DinB
MKTEIQKLTSLLHRTFEKGAWHGPTVKEVLQGITAATALNKLPNTHSIIELVSHMTSWRNFTIKKLEGDLDYKVSDEQNFPALKNWSQALQELDESQRNLLAAVEKFPVEKLSELVAGVTQKYTYYTLIHGIIHHDLYHTGQIILITKATATQTI